MNGVLRFVAGVLATALGTWLIGWTAPLLWGALAGLLWSTRRPARAVAIQSAVAWGLLLLFMAARGQPVGVLAARLAGAMQVPVWALILVTLLYPAVLAASAAWLVALPITWRAAKLRAR
jgi:hypothetical protein